MTYPVTCIRRALPCLIPLGIAVGVNACRPGDVLSVPPPTGVLAQSSLQGTAGAEAVYNGAEIATFNALGGSGGLILMAGYVTDEFTFAYYSFDGAYANVDARFTLPVGAYQESGTGALTDLLAARSSLLLAVPALQTYEPATGQWKVGEAYALMGYIELFLAEDYCAGVPLSHDLVGSGAIYGTPLTTDSLLQMAVAHFDSAIAHADGSDTVSALSSVGLGRALLDEGRYAAAATAVGSVPTSYVFNLQFEPPTVYTQYSSESFYASTLLSSSSYACSEFTVADREGGDGLNFLSANDPRLAFSTTVGSTCDHSNGYASPPFYYPTKFGAGLYIPLATGIEARLIEAEAALNAGQPNQWAGDLSTLRADSVDTHVIFPAAEITILADSTTGAALTAQQDFMFRERELWLYGTGTRLGDLRRLVRQYGRDQSTVFPSGPYANGANPGLPAPIPEYGTDVDLALPDPKSTTTLTTNPNYKGCVTPTSVA